MEFQKDNMSERYYFIFHLQVKNILVEHFYYIVHTFVFTFFSIKANNYSKVYINHI